MVRHSLNYVSWKRRPEVAANLKRIYTCATAEEAEQRLTEFEARWDKEYMLSCNPNPVYTKIRTRSLRGVTHLA